MRCISFEQASTEVYYLDTLVSVRMLCDSEQAGYSQKSEWE